METKKVKTVEIINPGNKRTFIVVEGEKYYLDREKFKTVDGIQHSIGLVYKKFDEKEYTVLLDILINAIKDKTTKKDLLTQILKDIDLKTLRRLAKRIKDKKPIKKHDGCLGFKIGDVYLELIE